MLNLVKLQQQENIFIWFLSIFQLWYEANRDINAGEEITIDGKPRAPIKLNDGFANGGDSMRMSMCHPSTSSSFLGDDRSERDNGKLKKLKKF